VKIVCDTNILVSGFMYSGNEREIIRKISLGEVINFTSKELLLEFASVIKRKKFKLNKDEQRRILKFLIEISEIVEPTKTINIIKEDPADNRVIEVALESRSRYIISGDKHLLNLRKYKNIKILSAREFIDILEK